ncbi:MAG: hypothetical protein K2G13_03010 [Muribaculaceae bacterium]|nr:hypothetical protein [Muribaculaceae bacterium]
MIALNIPLITWCIIVAAMTVLITVRLFHNNHKHMHAHSHSVHMLDIGSEQEEFFVPGDIVSRRDEAMNDVDY